MRVIIDATVGAEADVPKTREKSPSRPERLAIIDQYLVTLVT